ncbi:hypothetical protein P7C70_g4832, partial [Phenoliferia sp. Uapishka_3]
MASFGALYVVGGCRVLFSFGIYAGGPAALWSSMLITVVFMTITAASLAEICSSIPLSGSIYIWAAEAGGKKYGRLAGFIVAFWSTTAWTSFVASQAQAMTNYLLSELTVFNRSIPGDFDNTNVKFRAIVWVCSEVVLLLAILSNLMPPNRFSLIFKASAVIILLDFFLTIIWLPIGVSKTYGFQTKEFVFTTVYNGTGASDGWNWILSFLSTSGILTGFDASGHIAEETINASLVAARGIFWSCAVSGILAFPLIIVFLFCSPPLDVLFSIDAPQPFVTIYELALGRGGQMVMTLVAIIGLFINTSLCITAASRLVFGIARDGILVSDLLAFALELPAHPSLQPGSEWIGKVDANGQPKNAVKFIGIVASVLLCAILPSSVAFTSLISAGAVPTIAAYALIPILRLTFTRGDFANAKWSLGRYSKLFCVITAIWNTFLLAVLFSPYEFPVSGKNFNFACGSSSSAHYLFQDSSCLFRPTSHLRRRYHHGIRLLPSALSFVRGADVPLFSGAPLALLAADVPHALLLRYPSQNAHNANCDRTFLAAHIAVPIVDLRAAIHANLIQSVPHFPSKSLPSTSNRSVGPQLAINNQETVTSSLPINNPIRLLPLLLASFEQPKSDIDNAGLVGKDWWGVDQAVAVADGADCNFWSYAQVWTFLGRRIDTISREILTQHYSRRLPPRQPIESMVFSTSINTPPPILVYLKAFVLQASGKMRRFVTEDSLEIGDALLGVLVLLLNVGREEHEESLGDLARKLFSSATSVGGSTGKDRRAHEGISGEFRTRGVEE